MLLCLNADHDCSHGALRLLKIGNNTNKILLFTVVVFFKKKTLDANELSRFIFVVKFKVM